MFTLHKMMDRSHAVCAGEFSINNGQLTAHNSGTNVALLGGHTERVAFKKHWQWRYHKIDHSFWYLKH
jgi:prepilin-type processing-associated H-X9-DG protein